VYAVKLELFEFQQCVVTDYLTPYLKKMTFM